MACVLPVEGVQCHELDAGAKLLAALGQPVLVHGSRPAWDQVQQVGCGVVSPRVSFDTGEPMGPRWRLFWWCYTCSSTPRARTPAKRSGSSAAAWKRDLI